MKPRALMYVFHVVAIVAILVFATPVFATPAGIGAPVEPPTAQQAASGSSAQRPGTVEESITVTANRLPESLEDVGSTVTVITAEEIELSGARWLSDVLEWVPGVSVARSGGPGKVTSVFVRGMNSNHALVLINGVKVNSPTTGAYNFSGVPTSQIDRIEIVRGPQSSMYGSEAIGGVINILTKRGAGPAQGGFEVAGGSFSTGYFDGWVGGQAGPLEYSAGLLYFDSGGFSAASAERGNLEDDAHDNLTLDGRVGYQVNDATRIDGFLRVIDASTAIDGFTFGVGPSDDDNFEQTSRDVYGSVALHRRSARWETSVTAARSEFDLESVDPDASFFLGSLLDASVRELDWENRLALPAGQTLIGGLEYRRESAAVESNTTFGSSGFEEHIDVVGIYLHDRLMLADRVTVTFGGRYEDHSMFGGHSTFRASAVAPLGSGLRAHGSVGTGFRAPSLNDLYFPFFGNPEVRPEESTGFDIGISGTWRQPNLRFDATYFDNRVQDLIVFSTLTNVAENIGEASAKGVELSGTWAPDGRVSLAGAYTFTDTEDEDLGLQLLRRPRHQGSLRVGINPHTRVRASTELRRKGARADNGPAGRIFVDGYTLWNAAAEVDLTPHWALTVRFENLLDQVYEEVFGFGTAGFSAYAGVRVRVGRSQ